MNWWDDTINRFNAIRKRKTRKTHTTTPILKDIAHRKVSHPITFIKPAMTTWDSIEVLKLQNYREMISLFSFSPSPFLLHWLDIFIQYKKSL